MPATVNTIEVVLSADVMDSSYVDDFRQLRDRALKNLSSRHLRQQRIKKPYTITAWDEFQAVLGGLQALPEVLFDLRTEFAPLHLYIGVGLGAVEGWELDSPINESLSGDGFFRARKALGLLKEPVRGDELGKKGLRLSRFLGEGDLGVCQLLDLVYALHDRLVQQTSDKEWQVIKAMHQHQSGKKVAALLHKDESTISRQLKAGHYWQMRETVNILTKTLGTFELT